MITEIDKTFEYLAHNQSGDLRNLRSKVDVKQIVNLRDSGFLRFDKENNYQFTEKGIDYYSKEYAPLEKKNFLGL